MAFWGGARLAEEGAALAVVVPFDASRIDCSAYTLTLGAEAFVTPSYGDNPREYLLTPLVGLRMRVSASRMACSRARVEDFACARTRALIQNRHGPCIPPCAFA